MADMDQPMPSRAPWSPLPVDQQTVTTVPAATADGAIIRSPARPIDEVAGSGLAWPWDDPASAPRAVPARPVTTTDLYRPAVDSTGAYPGDGSHKGTLSQSPLSAFTRAQPTDPFRLPEQDSRSTGDNAGMRTWGVVLADVVATTLAATLDMYVNLRLTLITGAVLVLACVITALLVRRSDLSVAVITPPLAFVFAVAVAAATASFGETGSIVLRMGRDVFTALAFNAPFVFAGTALALIIVTLRAMRSNDG